MEIINANENKELFINLFNRYVIYAPYTVKLDDNTLTRHILGFGAHKENRALIGSQGSEYGIIHFGMHDENSGIIYLLFSDSNQMAVDLIKTAEIWFAEKKIKKIKAYLGFPSPYQYILHGSEPYCWAGNYHANNAFRRMGYDLDLDILVMSRKLHQEHTAFGQDDFIIRENTERDDELTLSGKFTAYKNSEWAGNCGYHYLKALSRQLGKKYGQIDIWLDEAFHGTILSKVLLSMAHGALIRLGVEQVMLATNQSLFRAVKFYEKTGYTPEPIKAYSYVKTLLANMGE